MDPAPSYGSDAEEGVTPAEWVMRPDREEPMEQPPEHERDGDAGHVDEQAAREDSGTPGQATPAPTEQGVGDGTEADDEEVKPEQS